MVDENADAPDALDARLGALRPATPPGLAERIADAAWDPAARRVFFWGLVAHHARRALVGAAALIIISVPFVLRSTPDPVRRDALVIPERDAAITVDNVAHVEATGQGLELRDARALPAIDGEEE